MTTIPKAFTQARTWIAAGLLAAHATAFAAGAAPSDGRVRILVQSSPLAGIQYYAAKQRWSEMRPGDRLDLVREADNPHDANAIRVEWQGHKLGYVPRRENQAVAREMDRGAALEARISRLQRHRSPWQRLRMDIYVVG
jgi:hypothetical protein